MGSTENCVKKLTRMKVVWRHFLVVMKYLASLEGKLHSNIYSSAVSIALIILIIAFSAL
jgi:hypothetical protein